VTAIWLDSQKILRELVGHIQRNKLHKLRLTTELKLENRSMNWEELVKTIETSLKEMFAEESKELSKDALRLKMIASDIVFYIKSKLSASTDTEEAVADRLLKHLKAEALLLAARHEVKARRNLANKIEIMARAGLSLIKAGIKGAL